ncbi:transmembrane protein 255B isoform X3 [Triplophysa rosa]|uniref:transmembrane protein 255B isoform X3 n=1 Tax=Triplophysa rosa TaxID=992332 RepID=UPI00254623BD|nr:transmembrane protein 255B isoform X3 [Triplophysa rosa]
MQSPETMNRHHSAPPHTVTDSVVMRRRKAQWLVSVMLCLSLVIVVLGIYTSTRTESVSITGYTSGIILAFGSFLGVLGLILEENRKKLLVAAIVFLSFGIISSFLCLVVDGVFILLTIDVRPLRAGRCQFYNSGNSYIYENYYATSCQDVLSLYVLLWVLTVLNLLGFVTGILTTAVLGSIKDMRSGGVCPDVPRWGGSSLLSFEGGNCSSPTAPLLMEASSQIGHQLYPRASLYISPASAGSSVQQTGSSYTSHTQTNPPPFAPLYNLLPDKTSTFCT